MDIPRIFNITESVHRIHNPIAPEKLAALGAALRLESGTRVLDLGSGSGEMRCTWARDHGVVGTGIDMSQLFTEQAKLRAEELGVADQVKFIHGDAAGCVSDEAAKWLTMRRWLDANPGDEFAKDVRAQLTSEPERYAADTREYLGWAVFALMPR
jgi:SAM-dependent methyltransferase